MYIAKPKGVRNIHLSLAVTKKKKLNERINFT
jgi:hypothetical protein